jgi:hypothetical protein
MIAAPAKRIYDFSSASNELKCRSRVVQPAHCKSNSW